MTEIDVRLSRDGAVVLLHDDTLQRTTGCLLAPEAMDLADIRQLDAGTWKSPQFAGERVPTLSEALAAVPTGKGILIEIKDGLAIVPPLCQAVAAGPLAVERVCFICFDRAILRAAKATLPQVKVLHLAGGAWENRVRTPDELDGLITNARAAGFDGLSLGDDWPLDAALIARVHAAGLECHMWTVNDGARARHLAAAGIDGITTDRPGWLREQMGGA